MRTLDDLPIVDSTGYPVDIGSELDGGNGVTGEIVDICHSCRRNGPKFPVVVIDWPDRDYFDPYDTELAFAGGYVVLLCPEVTSIDSGEAPCEPDGRRSYEFNPN